MSDWKEKVKKEIAVNGRINKSAELRKHIADIEALLSDGYSHSEVNHALNRAGFKMSLATFRSILYRTRKQVTSHTVKIEKRAEQKQNPASNGKETTSVQKSRQSKKLDWKGYRNRDMKDEY